MWIKYLLLGVFLILIPVVSGEPPIPGVEFYGWAVHSGGYARPDTIITAHFRDGEICGETRIVNAGQYSKLTCNANSSRIGQEIIFRLNYDKAKTSDTQFFTPGKMRHVDIFTGDLELAQTVFREVPSFKKCEDCLIKVALIGIFAIVILTLAFELGRWTQKKLVSS